MCLIYGLSARGFFKLYPAQLFSITVFNPLSWKFFAREYIPLHTKINATQKQSIIQLSFGIFTQGPTTGKGLAYLQAHGQEKITVAGLFAISLLATSRDMFDFICSLSKTFIANSLQYVSFLNSY